MWENKERGNGNSGNARAGTEDCWEYPFRKQRALAFISTTTTSAGSFLLELDPFGGFRSEMICYGYHPHNFFFLLSESGGGPRGYID
jgi:hypothetical protein